MTNIIKANLIRLAFIGIVLFVNILYFNIAQKIHKNLRSPVNLLDISIRKSTKGNLFQTYFLYL